MHTSRENNSKILRIKNANFLFLNEHEHLGTLRKKGPKTELFLVRTE